MGNFEFIRSEWPQVFEDCAKAESFLTNDARAACFYARRSIEVLTAHLFRLLKLAAPYQDDLSARIGDPAFKRVTGDGINQKLTLIRKMGNTAVHQTAPIPPRVALQVVAELHHVVIWAAYHYSRTPDAVPTRTQFDPRLAAKSAPLSPAEVAKLAQKFAEQDAAHAAALQEKESLLAERDAEIERLRAQVQASQAAKTTRDDHDYREDATRDLFVDLLLREAGWPLDQARDREFPVDGLPTPSGTGRVDYVRWGADGLPLALVEAKRTRRSPLDGQEQARLYADALERRFGRRPIIYFTNGHEHHVWDDALGYPPRQVSGFHTADELDLMIQRRTTRRPLTGEPVDADIAGRYYQQRAIGAVGDAFERRQRQALLVMATGTGKTRTAAALVKQLTDANWVKNVLFLADRTALVRQARNAFRDYVPNLPVVNLVEDRRGSGRVYFSTYQTMMGLVQELDENGRRRFGAGFFDLIVIDEAHRSVYAKYGYLFEHFDALLLGLTATPKDEVDHNTYRLFHLEDGVPTDAYSLDAAIADGYLVPPRGVSVGTTFLRRGIRYEDLSDQEKDAWDGLEWGEDGPPDAVDADEINRFLFNEDTVDKVLALLMESGHKVAGGDRLAKTIVFAKSRAHAAFILKRFDAGWPELAGRFASVITHETSFGDQVIEAFGNAESPPHIAISVDMLDTGIDVPDVANLVFFKPVRSKTKFWQMIGRGTRLRPGLYGPGEDKRDFFVFDFCGNLEYFGQDLPGAEGSTQKSLTQRIYEHRLTLVQRLDRSPGEGEDRELRARAAELLHEFVSGMTLDNVLVRPHRRAVEKFTDGAAWDALTPADVDEAMTLGGLPTAAQDPDEAAKRVDLLVLRAQVAQLDGDAAVGARSRETLQAIATALLGKTSIPAVAAQVELREAVAGDDWWVDVTLPMLELARLRLRSLAAFVTTSGRRNPVYTDFEDTLVGPTDVHLPGTTPGMDWDRFCAKATAHLRAHDDDVAVQKLRRNRQLTGTDLSALEAMLVEVGADAGHLERATVDAGGLGLFIRSLVGLDRAAAVEAFGDFLDDSTHTVEQIRLVESIIDELTSTGVMEPGRIYESPYTDDLPQGPDEIFEPAEVTALIDVLHQVRHHAVPEDDAA